MPPLYLLTADVRSRGIASRTGSLQYNYPDALKRIVFHSTISKVQYKRQAN